MEKELIFDLMNGVLDPEKMTIPLDLEIENVFEAGKKCEQLYSRVYEAKLRLEERLGADDDEDIEEIIACMSDIARVLAFKMYDYAKSEK